MALYPQISRLLECCYYTGAISLKQNNEYNSDELWGLLAGLQQLTQDAEWTSAAVTKELRKEGDLAPCMDSTGPKRL